MSVSVRGNVDDEIGLVSDGPVVIPAEQSVFVYRGARSGRGGIIAEIFFSAVIVIFVETDGIQIIIDLFRSEGDHKTGIPNGDKIIEKTGPESGCFSVYPAHHFGVMGAVPVLEREPEGNVQESGSDSYEHVYEPHEVVHIVEQSRDHEEEFENQEEKQLYDCYKKLNCDIRSISKDEEIYSKLNKYLTAKIISNNKYIKE